MNSYVICEITGLHRKEKFTGGPLPKDSFSNYIQRQFHLCAASATVMDAYTLFRHMGDRKEDDRKKV